MAKAAEKLPEKSIQSGEMVDVAAQLAAVHTQLASLQSQEKELKTRLAELCDEDRQAELAQNNYVGLYRLIPEDSSPSRVEFRLESKGKVDKRVLEMSEAEILDELLGESNRKILFEEVWRTGTIPDPAALIQDLHDKGYDPNEVLDITVKPGCEKAVAETCPNWIESWHVLMPKKGFLNALNAFKAYITDRARAYLKSYLEATLGTKVCPGTKGSDD